MRESMCFSMNILTEQKKFVIIALYIGRIGGETECG